MSTNYNENSRDHLVLRPAESTDRDAVIQLIDSVYREYGDQVCLGGAEADLLEIPQYYRAQSGEFWVLADPAGKIQGTHGVFAKDTSRGVCGFRRLYLARHQRGSSWGWRLMQTAIDFARERGFKRVEFWSDVRFQRAHQFFAKFGFRTDGRRRDKSDGHLPYTELFFYLDLASGSKRSDEVGGFCSG